MKLAQANLRDSIRDDISRTAIVLDSTNGEGTSVDLITPSGQLVARLNMFAHDSGNFTFDLCLKPADARFPTQRITHWNKKEKPEDMPVRNDIDASNADLITIQLRQD